MQLALFAKKIILKEFYLTVNSHGQLNVLKKINLVILRARSMIYFSGGQLGTYAFLHGRLEKVTKAAK